MPIAVTCACGKRLNVKDDLAGKRIKCPACMAAIDVPEGRYSEDDERDDSGGRERRRSEKKEGGSAKIILMVGGALLLASCCCAGGVGGTAMWIASTVPDARTTTPEPPEIITKLPPPNAGPKMGVVELTSKKLGPVPVTESDRWLPTDAQYKLVVNGIAFLNPAKAYKVQLVGGRTYTIDLTNNDRVPDPYLIIEDASGAKLAEDDDSGGLLNARIRFVPPRDGEYKIIAMTINNGFGPFTLTIQDGMSKGKKK